MASAAEVRAWAKSQGHPDARERGNLGQGLIADWNRDHPDDPYGAAGVQQQARQMTAEEMEDLFADDAPPLTLHPDMDGDGLGETRPRKPPAARKPAKGGGMLAGLGLGQPKGKTAKKKPPRVSTENLIGSIWRAGAKLAAPLPPLYRVLRIQAPVAGILLEDSVKGTMADTVLQPLARMANAGQTVNALLGPPLYVTALTMHAAQAAAQNVSPNPLVMTLGVEGLRSSLMAWMDIAGPKFAVAMAREREFEEKYGAQVDEFISWLLAPPPSNATEQQAEEMMFARATGQAGPATM